MKKPLIALVLVGALLGLGASTVTAGQRGPARPVWSHMVAPGETLWELAREAVPGRDTRETVDRLIRTNKLNGGAIRPGQRLVLLAN